MIILELDGQERSVRTELRAAERAPRVGGTKFVQRELGAEGCERIWEVRREFSYSLRDTGLTKLNEDIAVPRSRLVDLFVFARRLQKKHDIPVACFGHAGDGNIHVNVMLDKSDVQQAVMGEQAVEKIFAATIKLGGTLSGEHGIGNTKSEYFPLEWSPATIAAMRLVKRAFDPHNILNPGKIFPS